MEEADGKSNAKVAAPWEASPVNCSRRTRNVVQKLVDALDEWEGAIREGLQTIISGATCVKTRIPTAWLRLC